MERLNFTNSINVQAQIEKGRAVCNMLGGNDMLCHQNRSLASDITAAHHCYLNWTPDCHEHMTHFNKKYNVHHDNACLYGMYDNNPNMKKYLCKKPLFETYDVAPCKNEHDPNTILINKMHIQYKGKCFNNIKTYIIVYIIIFFIIGLIIVNR